MLNNQSASQGQSPQQVFGTQRAARPQEPVVILLSYPMSRYIAIAWLSRFSSFDLDGASVRDVRHHEEPQDQKKLSSKPAGMNVNNNNNNNQSLILLTVCHVYLSSEAINHENISYRFIL